MEELGSTWNKWDLHVHTPCSLTQQYGGDTDEAWENFILDLEKLPSELKVIGINDYWFLDGYRKVLSFKKNGRIPNIQAIFPVIEFRIKKFAGVDFGKLKRINLHVIFAPDFNPDTIESQFLSTLQASYYLDPEVQDYTWSGAITKQSLVDLGKAIREKVPEEKRSKLGSDIDVGFGNLNVDDERIFTQLKSPYFKGKCFVTIGKTEWADLKWTEGTIGEKKDIINKVDFVFTCVDTVEEFYKARDALKNQNVRNLLLDCSDAHNYSTQKNKEGDFVKERVGNVLTWIKAEPTFEGLRQVLFEPNDRIVISENQPRQPIRKIQSIKFNFPENTQIKNRDSHVYQDLCIRKIKEINFSPYFTCLIGGRGTGKSTTINIIAERLGAKNDFFLNKHNGLYKQIANQNPNWYNLQVDEDNYVDIVGTNEVEFISQGKVESLTNGEELTKLIFEERILQLNPNLEKNREKIKSISTLIDDQIELIGDFSSICNQITSKEKERKNHESVISSVNDPEYLEISQSINKLKTEIASVDHSKVKYQDLLSEIKSLLDNKKLTNGTSNEYEDRFKEIVNYILALEEFSIHDEKLQFENKIFDITEKRRGELANKLLEEREKLFIFFKDKGTSEESINDSQNANDSLTIVQNSIRDLNHQRDSIKLEIEANQKQINIIKELKTTTIDIIQDSVDDLNAKLKIKDDNVSPIHYEYNFNSKLFKNGLFEQFEVLFKKFHISNTSWSSVKDILFVIEPDQALVEMSYDSFFKQLTGLINKSNLGNNNYSKILLSIFEDKARFASYRLLVQKHLNNVFEYVAIKGYYGTRELKACSFGQKCTAVIVTLLMTGVKPLIIDEPEAHLDNRLIADYLVNLIKEKKFDRQIIFATHNANFVINGDAELIQILEIPDDDNFTSITKTTIENTNNRDKLLKLEGGREAFKKRESKLLIK